MQKKVLILSSSPRVKGNTDLLCDMFAKGAADAGHEVEKISLNQKKIGYCQACAACRKNGGTCILGDDGQEIVEKLVASDVFVLASPVYYGSISGQLKTLIDRTYSHTSDIHDKTAYFILASGAKTKEGVAGAVSDFRGFLENLKNVREGGIVYGTGAYYLGDIQNHPALKEAYEMGKSI